MALSGSLVIYSLRRAARPPPSPATATEPTLRPCLSSTSERRTGAGRPRRRVRFAEGVVDNEGAARTCKAVSQAAAEQMPANREALYCGMLRDRSTH